MLVSVSGFGHLVILKACVVYLSLFRQMFVVCNSGYWYYYQMQPKSDMEFSCKQIKEMFFTVTQNVLWFPRSDEPTKCISVKISGIVCLLA